MPRFSKVWLAAFLILLVPAAIALQSPTISSPTSPEGEWSNLAPFFSWDNIEGAIRYCYILDSETDTIPLDEGKRCTTNTSVQLPTKLNSGDYYFHIKAISATEASPTATHHIKLDVDNPTRPRLEAKAKSDGTIELEWTASEDASSGVKEYEIYRKLMGNFDLRTTPIYTTVSGSALDFFDSGSLDQSTTYHYKIRAIDNAGNVGAVSNEVFAETAAVCDLGIEFSVELSESQDNLLLSITANDKIYHPTLKATLPDQTEHTFFEERAAFLDWSETFDLTGIEEGFIDFSLQAQELFGDDCSQEKRFAFDVTEPEISFLSPKYNDMVSETVPLKVRVEDKGSFKSGLEPVAFYVKENGPWSKIGSVEADENSVALLEWNSFDVENGQRKVKAVVVDTGGNRVEAVQTLNVLNAFEGALDLNAATGKALKAREKALEEKWRLSAKGIVSETVDRLLEEGDSNMAEAMRIGQLPGLENETNAKMMLAQAIVLYNESKGIVTTSEYKTADFVFNKEQVDILLGAAGISGTTLQQAKEAIEKAQPKRQLQILSVEDDNASYYRALIVVSFELDVNILRDTNDGERAMQIIEAIPKEFAEYAAEVDSNVFFAVLYDDPKLAFFLERQQYKTKKLVYALKTDLSQQQADALVEDNVINKFVAPPIMLPAQASAGIFGISPDFVVYLFAAVIVAAAAVFVLLALKKGKLGLRLKKKKRRFESEKKPEKPKPKPKPEPKPEKPGSEKPEPEKPKKPFGGLRLPRLPEKKSESPLSVFGKK